MGSLTNDFGTSAALSGGGGAVLLTATNQEVPAGGIAIINDTTQFYNVSTSAQMANNTDLSVFTAANNWRPVGDGDTVALTNEVKHNTSHINTIDGELQAITNPTATFAFGTALGGNWGTLEAFYEDATRTLTVTTTDPNGLPNEWENLNRGTILYGFDTGVTPATDGSNNSSFSMEVTSVAFQQVRLRAANDASNTFLTGRGSLSFGIRDYNDTEENTLFGGLRTATITDVVDAIVGSQANGDLIRLGVGTNLSITGGVLNASGTGGSGGDNVDLVGAPVGIDVTLPITADATDLTFNVRISARQAIASGVSYSWGGVALTGGGTSLSEGPQTVTLTLPGAGRATLSADARDTPPVVVIAGTGETYPITTSTPDTDTTYTITTGSSASGAVIELDASVGTDSTVTILSGTNTTVRESSTGNIEINADVQDSIIGIGGGDGIQIQDDIIIPSGRWEYVTVSSGDSSMAVTFAGTTNFPVPAFMEGIGVSVTAITQMVNATPIDFTFTAQQTSETLLTPAIPSGAANIQPNWASEATAAHVGGDLTLVDFTATNGATIPRVFQDGYRLGADDTVNTGEPERFGNVVGTPAAGTVRVQFPGDFPIANANARFTLQGQTAAYREVTTAITLTRPLDDGNINNITAIGSLNAAAEFVVATAYDAATRVLTVIAGLNSQGNGGIAGGLDVEITYGVAFVHNVETFTLPNRAFDNTSQTVTVTRDGATVANTFTIVGNILTITLDNVGGNINPWQGGDMVEVTYNQAIEGDSVTGTIGTIADPAGTNSQVINFTANFTAGGPGVTYSITSQGRMTEGDGNFTLNQITNEDFGFTVDYEAGGFYNLPAIRELRNEIEQLRLGTSAVTDTSVPFGFVPYPNANLNNNQTSSNVPTDSSLRFVLPPTTNHAFGELSFARQYSTTVFRGQNILRAVSMFYGGNEIGRNIGTSLFNPMHRAIFRGNQINWATTGGSTIRRGDTRIVDGGSTTSIFRTMEYVLTYARQYDEELAAPFHPNTVPAPGQPLTQVAGFENFSGWGFGITAEDLGASTIWTSERDPNTNDRIGYNEFIVCFSRGDRTLNPSMAIDSCLALRRRFKYTDGELTGDNPLNRPLTTNADVGRYVASNFADFYEIVGGSMPRELVISDVASNNFWMQIFLLEPAQSLGFQPTNFSLSQGSQFGRREIQRFSTANQFTGVAFKYFQAPNTAADYAGTATADAQARPEINEARLYENETLTPGATGVLQRIKTDWDALPTFDPEDTTARNSRIGITYTRAENPTNVVRTSINKNTTAFGNTQVSERQMVQMPFGQDLEYLNIMFDGSGDFEISDSGPTRHTATSLQITEIYGADEGFPDDLHVLTHERVGDLRRNYPLPIEETWLPDQIGADIILHPSTQQIDNFSGDGSRTVFQLSQFPNSEVTVAFVDGSGTATVQTTGFSFDPVQNQFTFDAAPTANTVRFTYTFEDRTTTNLVLARGATAAESTFAGSAASISVDRTPGTGPLPVLVAEQITGATTTVASEVGLTVDTSDNSVNIGVGTGGTANGSLRVRGLSGTGTRNISADTDGNIVIDTSGGGGASIVILTSTGQTVPAGGVAYVSATEQYWNTSGADIAGVTLTTDFTTPAGAWSRVGDGGASGGGNPYEFARNNILTYDDFATGTATVATSFKAVIRDVIERPALTSVAGDDRLYDITWVDQAQRDDLGESGNRLAIRPVNAEEFFVGIVTATPSGTSSRLLIFNRVNDSTADVNDRFAAVSPTNPAPGNLTALETGMMQVVELTDAIPVPPDGQANNTTTNYNLTAAVDGSGVRVVSWTEDTGGAASDANPVVSAVGRYFLPFANRAKVFTMDYTLSSDVTSLQVLDIDGNVVHTIGLDSQRMAGVHEDVFVNISATEAASISGNQDRRNHPLVLRANGNDSMSALIAPRAENIANDFPATGEVEIVPGGIAIVSATEQYYNIGTATQIIEDGTPSIAFTNTGVWTRVGDGGAGSGNPSPITSAYGTYTLPHANSPFTFTLDYVLNTVVTSLVVADINGVTVEDITAAGSLTAGVHEDVVIDISQAEATTLTTGAESLEPLLLIPNGDANLSVVIIPRPDTPNAVPIQNPGTIEVVPGGTVIVSDFEQYHNISTATQVIVDGSANFADTAIWQPLKSVSFIDDNPASTVRNLRAIEFPNSTTLRFSDGTNTRDFTGGGATGDRYASNISSGTPSTVSLTAQTPAFDLVLVEDGLAWATGGGQLADLVATAEDSSGSTANVILRFETSGYDDSTDTLSFGEQFGQVISGAVLTSTNSLSNIVVSNVSLAAQQGPQGIQGLQGIGIASLTAPAMPMAGSLQTITVTYNDPAGTTPMADTFQVPAGAQGALGPAGPQGFLGPFTVSLYAQIAGIGDSFTPSEIFAEVPMPADLVYNSTTGILTGTNVSDDDVATASANDQWTTTRPNTITTDIFVIQTVVSQVSNTGVDMDDYNIGTLTNPFRAAASGPAGPTGAQGPAGRNPLLNQQFFVFNDPAAAAIRNQFGTAGNTNPIFGIDQPGSTEQVTVANFFLGTEAAINTQNAGSVTADQSQADNDLAIGTTVGIGGFDPNTNAFIFILSGTITDINNTGLSSPSIALYQIRIDAVVAGAATTGITATDIVWTVAVAGARGPQGEQGMAATLPAVTANQYLRSNAAGDSYVSRTNAQVAADIGAVTAPGMQSTGQYARYTGDNVLEGVSDEVVYSDIQFQTIRAGGYSNIWATGTSTVSTTTTISGFTGIMITEYTNISGVSATWYTYSTLRFDGTTITQPTGASPILFSTVPPAMVQADLTAFDSNNTFSLF